MLTNEYIGQNESKAAFRMCSIQELILSFYTPWTPVTENLHLAYTCTAYSAQDTISGQMLKCNLHGISQYNFTNA